MPYLDIKQNRRTLRDMGRGGCWEADEPNGKEKTYGFATCWRSRRNQNLMGGGRGNMQGDRYKKKESQTGDLGK